MQADRLGVLEDDAAVAVDDRLGQARSCPTSRGPTAGGRTARVRRSAVRAARRSGRPRSSRRGRPGRPRGRDTGPGPSAGASAAPRGDRSITLATVERLAAVRVAVDGDENGSARSARSGRSDSASRSPASTRPDRTEARAGEQGDDRLGDVRDDGRDAIATADAEAAQPGRDGRDRVDQLRPADSRNGWRSDWKSERRPIVRDAAAAGPPRSSVSPRRTSARLASIRGRRRDSHDPWSGMS